MFCQFFFYFLDFGVFLFCSWADTGASGVTDGPSERVIRGAAAQESIWPTWETDICPRLVLKGVLLLLMRLPDRSPELDKSRAHASRNVLQHFRERKRHKHKQICRICRIVPGLGGWQKYVYVIWGYSLWGRKTHKQNPPQNPGIIP